MPAAHAKAPSGLDDAIVAAIAGNTVRVLPLPATTAKLMGLVNQRDFSLRQVAKIVAQDQALAAYVLRQASSAGRAGRVINSIQDAVSVLGAKETMSMAVALGMGSQICTTGSLQALKLEVWRHSTFGASFCRSMAKYFKVAEDQAFLIGLLANFGRSVALSCIEDALPKDCPPMPRDFWLEIVERHEHDLGLVMAAKWDLPPIIPKVLSAVRRGGADANKPLVRLVRLANAVVELVDKVPQVTDEALAQLPGLENPRHRTVILRVLQAIGLDMLALNPAEPEPAAPSESLVAFSGNALAAAVKGIEARGPAKIREEYNATPVDFGVTVYRNKGNRQCRCIAMTHEGLVMVADGAMPANWMVRLTLKSDPDVTLCGTVVHSQERDEGHLVAVRRMTLGPEDLLCWTRLVAGPDRGAVPASVREAAPVNDQAPSEQTSARVTVQAEKLSGPQETVEPGPRPAPPAPAPAPAPARPAAGSGASLNEDSGPPWGLIAAVVAVVALAGGIAAFLAL